MTTKRLLLLAGTGEAQALALALTERSGLDVTASLAGVTSDPAPYPCATRTGGFGGSEGLADWMQQHHTDLLIDATHPFASQMHANAARAALAIGLPRLRLSRPPWPDRPGWVHAATIADAAQKLPTGARALLTTGRNEIVPFAVRTDCQLTLRSIEPAPDLPPHIHPLQARPPFTADSERALFALLGITHLVSKNAGGSGTAKLDVADQMRLTTIMIARPAPPPGPVATTTDEAVAWVRDKVAF